MAERVTRIVGHLATDSKTDNQLKQHGVDGTLARLTITDSRSGKSADFPIKNGNIICEDLWKKFQIRSYDPGYMNTSACTSRICYIDGDNGILEYRGYPIEQLAEKSTFLEVSFLLIFGELPTKGQLAYFSEKVMRHTYVHEDIKTIMRSFRYDSHPMGMLISGLAAMSTFHPEANPALAGQSVYDNKAVRNKQLYRLIGTVPTLSAISYRQRIGRPFVDPAPAAANLTYAENFLYMLDKLSQPNYRPHPVLARALDILFILHADHEQNCSTSGMRHLMSSGVDVYTAVAGSAAALYGPRHGGANEAVLRMLVKIGSKENIPQFIDDVKNKKGGGSRLMGFGHRVYKNHDPRAKIIKRLADDVFAVLGKEPLIEVAVELERIALSDKYFIDRKLYPNVDFYSGLIYKAMGFPTDFFPVLFTIPRTVGWLSHWNEFLDDPENKIVRPRQVYLGYGTRPYVPLEARVADDKIDSRTHGSAEARRRDVAST